MSIVEVSTSISTRTASPILTRLNQPRRKRHWHPARQSTPGATPPADSTVPQRYYRLHPRAPNPKHTDPLNQHRNPLSTKPASKSTKNSTKSTSSTTGGKSTMDPDPPRPHTSSPSASTATRGAHNSRLPDQRDGHEQAPHQARLRRGSPTTPLELETAAFRNSAHWTALQ